MDYIELTTGSFWHKKCQKRTRKKSQVTSKAKVTEKTKWRHNNLRYIMILKQESG